LLSATFPKAPIDKLDIKTLVQYYPIMDLYQNDPLVYHGQLPARLAYELLSNLKIVNSEIAAKITIPYILIHGTSDKICGIRGSDGFHAATSSKEKRYEKLTGAHELLNEGSGEAVTIVVNWLKARL